MNDVDEDRQIDVDRLVSDRSKWRENIYEKHIKRKLKINLMKMMTIRRMSKDGNKDNDREKEKR